MLNIPPITKGISIPTPFFPLKWSKSKYGVRNASTQLHISLHNEIYSINGFPSIRDVKLGTVPRAWPRRVCCGAGMGLGIHDPQKSGPCGTGLV
ncbi:hypothetical protein YC2023_021108 [Brassica napus]